MRLFRLALIALLIGLILSPPSFAQSPPGSRDLEVRTRYEAVLARSPFQEQAFERAYQLYTIYEGVEAWDQALAQAQVSADSPVPALVVRARIAARRFDSERAVALLEEAREAGADGAEFALFLGRLYHDTGQNEAAVSILEDALEEARTPEERGRVSRLLGNLLMRTGQREAAIAAWERIAEGDAADVFALEELAVLYEGQRMWPEAAAGWSRVAEAAEGDPYLRCRALRAVGDAERAQGDYRAAVEAYREALEWVAPGNWLFDALTQSLVDTHAAMGDLPALVGFLEESLRTNPAQTEFRVLLGDVHGRMADWEAADAAYLEAIARAPSQRQGYAARIRLQETLGDDAGLIEAYEAAIARFPGEREYHRRLGEAHLREGNREAALSAWRAAFGGQPEAADFITLASWLETRGFRDEARDAYADAIALNPRRSWSMRLAALEFETGHRESARARWLAIAGDDAGPDDLLDVAVAMEARGFPEDAERLLGRALEIAPERMDILLVRADVLLALGRHEDADTAYGHLLANATSDFHRTRAERGLLDALEAQGRLAEVRSEWEQRIRADRSDAALRIRLAQLYERMGDRNRALALFIESTQIEPENAAMLQQLARAYESSGFMAEAIAAYRRLIELEPGRAGGYYRELVPLLAQHGTEEEAIEAAQRVVEGAPMDPEARTLLARVYERFERTGPRLEAHREAVRLSPDDAGYHEAFGRALIDAGAFVEARDAFRAMLDTGRDSGVRLRAVQHLAEAHARLDRTEELVREFENRIQSTPRELENYEMLAAVHRVAGAPGDALAVLERAAEVSDDRETALRRVLLEAHAGGNLETVIRAFEELQRLGTALDPREWEQLGRSYAQLGQMVDANRAWENMLRDYVHDATVLRAYIRLVREYGLQDEVFHATEQLLAIEQYDFQTRLDFAQQLASADRVQEAMEHLRMLMRLGAGAAREESTAERTPAAIQHRIPPHLALSASQIAGSSEVQAMLGIGAAQQYRPFETARRHALHLLAQYASREGTADALVAEYRAAVDQAPDATAPYHDLVLVLATLNRQEALVALLAEMRGQFHEDLEVIQLVAQLLEAYGEYDRAMVAYDRQHDLENANDATRMGTRIRLLAAAGRREEVRAQVQALREAFPERVGELRRVAAQLAAIEELPLAEELYRAVIVADERHYQTVLQELAHHYRNRGHAEDAARIYGELLFVPPAEGQAQHPPPDGLPPLYLPQSRPGAVQSVDAAMRLLVHRPDWPRMEAFQQTLSLTTDAETLEGIMTRMRETAQADPRPDAESQRLAYDLGLLLAAHAIQLGEPEQALDWIPYLERLQATPETLANLRLLALERAGDLEGMRAVYGELAESRRQEAETMRLAQARLAVLEADWEAAETAMSGIVHALGRQRDIVGMIRQMHDAGEHERADRLLSAYLTDPNPIPDAFGLRIILRSALGRHEEAMAFARESWEYTVTQQYGGRTPRLGQVRSARELEGSPMVQLLYTTYEAAGRERDLLTYLEQSAADAPNNARIQLDLAHVYRALGRQRQAMAVYRGLVDQRPGDRTLRLAYAQILTANQSDAEAYALYDEALRANPGLFREHAWHVRQLYDRMGKSRELVQLEERLAQASTDIREIQQLAQEADNQGNADLAATLYERMVRMAPGEQQYLYRLAENQRRAGRIEESVATWESHMRQLAGQPDQTPVELARAVPLFVHTGKRGELESLTQSRLSADSDDPLGLVLQAGLSQHDGDYRRAMAALERLLDARPADQTLFAVLVNLARFEGLFDKAIRLIDERSPALSQSGWNDIAELYAAKGDADRAFEYWQRDAARHTGQHGLEQTLRKLVEHGMYDKAVVYFDQYAARVQPAQTLYDNFVQHALRAYLRGGEAPEEWVRGVLRAIRDEPAWVLSGLIQANEGPVERRQTMLRWALEERPRDANVMRTIVLHARQGWDDEGTLELLEDAVALHPGNSEAESGFVALLTQRGEYDRALAFLEDAMDDAITPDRLEFAFRVCVAANEYGRLIALRDRAWPALAPADQERLAMQWAQSFARGGDLETGLDSVRSAWEDSPGQENLDRYLDMMFRSTDGREAFAAFEEALGEGYYKHEGHLHVPIIHLMASTGRLDELFALVWTLATESENRQGAATLQRVVGVLRSAGAAAPFLREWLARLDEDEHFELSLAMRNIEAAQRNLMSGWYDQSLATGLSRHPEHWDLLYRYAQRLQTMGYPAEAAALLETALANAPASRRAAVRSALLELHAGMGNTSEVEHILIRNLHFLPLQPHEFGVNTQLLTLAGRHDEAAEEASRWAQAPMYRVRALGERTASWARAGRVDEALSAFEAQPDLGAADAVLGAMLAQDRLDAALRLTEISTELRGNPHLVYAPLVNAMLAAMAYRECEAALVSLRRRLLESPAQSGFVNETVHAMMRHRDADEVLAFLAALDEAELWSEGARVLALTAVERGGVEAERLASRLGAAIGGRPAAMLSAVDALMLHDAKELARILLHALEDVPEFDKAQALSLARLAMRAEASAAPALFAHAFSLDPALLLEAADGAAVLAVSDEEMPLAEWLAAASEAAPYPEQVLIVEAAIAMAQGKADAADAMLASLDTLSRLRGGGVEGLALWMAHHGHEAALMSFGRRVAADSVQRETRVPVLEMAVLAAAGIGDAESVIVFLDALLWLGMPEPWALLEKSAAVWPADAIAVALDRLEAAREERAMGPASLSLAYLESLLSRLDGGGIEPLVDGWGLASWQADLIRLGLQSPRSWWVSPRFPSPMPETLNADPPAPIVAAMLPGNDLDDLGGLEDLDGWAPRARLMTDPAALPGAFTPVLTPSTADHCVYLATDLYSPDARTVQFATSGNDWHRVWVNGEEVFRDPRGGPVIAMEDRFEAQLEAGRNRVVIWLGTTQGTASLSFGIMENGGGLRFETEAEVEGRLATR